MLILCVLVVMVKSTLITLFAFETQVETIVMRKRNGAYHSIHLAAVPDKILKGGL